MQEKKDFWTTLKLTQSMKQNKIENFKVTRRFFRKVQMAIRELVLPD